MAAGVLSRDEIKARKGEIFVDGTFSKHCLRAAAYDLRLSEVISPEDHTGTVHNDVLTLTKGQRAVVETYECIAMPWDLAGNLGVKFRVGIEGLFVTPGLFIDPGYGWAEGPCGSVPEGARLRFMVTNTGQRTISIKLGREGNRVVGIQFLRVKASKKKQYVELDQKTDPQGLAFFEDLTNMEKQFAETIESARRTEKLTEMVILLGIFLIAFTILGASLSFILATIGEGKVTKNVIHDLNALDVSSGWTVFVLVCLAITAVYSLVRLSLLVKSLFKRMAKSNGAAPTE